MEPSSEVKKLMTQFYAAASKGKFDDLDKFVSHRAGVLWIGTDPNEWWQGPQSVFQGWREQMSTEGGAATISGGEAMVYQHGDVAWVSDRPQFHLPDGRTVPFRFTVVWEKEPEGWRIVQAHASFGVPNEVVLLSKVFAEK